MMPLNDLVLSLDMTSEPATLTMGDEGNTRKVELKTSEKMAILTIVAQVAERAIEDDP